MPVIPSRDGQRLKPRPHSTLGKKMSNEIFRQGGPHRIRKTGRNEHTFFISLPTDRYGRVARECPNEVCSPGEFKITPGTGITDEQEGSLDPWLRRRIRMCYWRAWKRSKRRYLDLRKLGAKHKEAAGFARSSKGY